MTLTKLLKFGTGFGGYDKEVASVQKMLKDLGYYKGNIDGQFGSLTLGAVKNFQKDYNLMVDGIVGPNTFNKLLEVYNQLNKPVNSIDNTSFVYPQNTRLDIEVGADNSTLLIFAGLGLALWYFMNKK